MWEIITWGLNKTISDPICAKFNVQVFYNIARLQKIDYGVWYPGDATALNVKMLNGNFFLKLSLVNIYHNMCPNLHTCMALYQIKRI